MPFKRRRRYSYKKKNNNTYKSLSKQISYLRKITRPEFKSISTDSSAFGDILNTASVEKFVFPKLEQGTDSHQRVGDRVRIRRISFNILSEPSTEGQATFFRVILMVVKDVTGSGRNLSEFLKYTTDDRSMSSHYVEDQAGLFKVMYDRTFQTRTTGDYRRVSIKKRMNLPVSFSGSGASETTIHRNGLYLFIVNSSAANLTNWYDLKVWFTDS